MKIQGNRPENDAAAIAQKQKLERATSEGRQAGAAGKPGQGDRVDVSSDAALASSAAKAASEAPDVRTELVNRMRSLMEKGELGADAEKLADSLIDTMLGEK